MVMRGGLDGDFDSGACEFVGGSAVDFFCGEDGWDLVDLTPETLAQVAKVFEGSREWPGFVGGSSFGVVGVGGKAEPDVAGVVFFGLVEELGETGKFAE